jgi:hypothetical protein
MIRMCILCKYLVQIQTYNKSTNNRNIMVANKRRNVETVETERHHKSGHIHTTQQVTIVSCGTVPSFLYISKHVDISVGALRMTVSLFNTRENVC